MSKTGFISTAAITVGAGVCLVLTIFGIVSWLNFLYLLSYIKLVLTIVKYIPQVYLNYQRKSTKGWSIVNVMLDFTGGVLSIIQIILDSIISNTGLSGIMGNLTKLALGVVTIIFDSIFLTQHYVWFPEGHGPHIIEMDETGHPKDDKDSIQDEGQRRALEKLREIDEMA